MRKALHPQEDPPPSVRGEVQSRGSKIEDAIQREKGDNLLEELVFVVLELELKAVGWMSEVVPGVDGSSV